MAATVGSEHATTTTFPLRQKGHSRDDIPLIRGRADLTFASDTPRETAAQIKPNTGTAKSLSLADGQAHFQSSTGLDNSAPSTTSRWVPSRPTQAFLAAKRKPHLVKLQQYLKRLVTASEARDQMIALTLCREQLERAWDHVDARDEYVAQYLQLIDGGLDQIARGFTPQRVRAVADVVEQVLEMHFDYEARREARLKLMRAQAFKMPEPSLEQALLFAIEDATGDEEGEGEH
jgi:hypothetical protein